MNRMAPSQPNTAVAPGPGRSRTELGRLVRRQVAGVAAGLVLFSALSAAGWVAVLGVEPGRGVMAALAGALVTAVAGGVGAWMVARRMTRRLQTIAAEVEAVLAGGPGGQVAVGMEAEFPGLAPSVHRLAWSLQEARTVQEAEEQKLRRAQEVMQRSRDFLNNLVESLPQFIDQKDVSGRYTFVTEFVCRAFGREREEMLGLTEGDLFPPEMAQPRISRHELVVAGRKAIEAVERLALPDGSMRWLKSITMPLSDEGGGLLGTQSVAWDVTELKRAEEALVQAHEDLVKASRLAGMAEIATGILHNVGNVLNSVNVSTTLIHEQVKKSRVSSLGRVVALLEEHRTDLGTYLTVDPKGTQLPGYLASLARHLETEREELLREIRGLADSVDHVKQIVAMQQAYAKAGGVLELLALPELVEDALRLNAARVAKAGIEVVRRFDDVPSVLVDRHRTLQILVNLVTNAVHAIHESATASGRVVVGLSWDGANRVRLSVEDNGRGIAPDHLHRVFQHGFTTRKDGHGFGLHSGALAAKEMGGSLSVHSAGPGLGATFVLELPAGRPEARAAA